MRARIGGAVGLIAVAIVVAGCNGSEQPSALPDATSTASAAPTTESRTATPTDDPTAQLEAEITAFFDEYAQAINESWASAGALAKRREMFADSCVSCLAGYKLAEQAVDEGHRLVGGMASLRAIELDRIDGDVVTVSAFTDSEAGHLIDDADNVVQEFEASSNVQIVYQLRSNDSGGWVILSGEVLS
jgi:hypothetical protein